VFGRKHLAFWVILALLGMALIAAAPTSGSGSVTPAAAGDAIASIAGGDPAMLSAKPNAASERLSPASPRGSRLGVYLLAAVLASLLGLGLSGSRWLGSAPAGSRPYRAARRSTPPRGPPLLLLATP
jgi:hypothetical protein